MKKLIDSLRQLVREEIALSEDRLGKGLVITNPEKAAKEAEKAAKEAEKEQREFEARQREFQARQRYFEEKSKFRKFRNQ